ncbi:MAG: hypothetical protein Q9199_003455, partial [Rusavskia elegans]
EIGGTGQAKQQKVSSRRRQLHVLYLLHDFVHHVKFHGARLADGTSVIRALEAYVTQMVTLAATYDPSRYSRHLGILNDLINIWGESNYFPSSVVAVLRDTLTNATDGSMSAAQNTEPSETRIVTAGNGIGGIQKDAPYIMPASHGDASVLFYDLPAGNLLPCIIPNSLTPISPQMVKPLQFRAGPADEELAHAVKAFLKDIDVLYGYRLPGQGYDGSDVDQLGQPTALDDTPEDIPASEGYYGWSKAFCEKMKLRSSGDRRASSPPRLEVSQQPRKRRRRSYSTSGRSLSRSSATSRSRSRGKRASPPRRPESDSGSRSQSRRQHYRMSEFMRSSPPAGALSSRSRSRSYSPPDVAAPKLRDGHLDDNATPGLAGEQTSQVIPLPPAFLQQSFLNPGQIPIPPPPPPNYTGPWPPPPPPPPSLSAPKFTPQKPAQIPPLPTYALDKSASSPSPQYPSHVSSLGTAQTFYGQASGNFPSQAYQGLLKSGLGNTGSGLDGQLLYVSIKAQEGGVGGLYHA